MKAIQYLFVISILFICSHSIAQNFSFKGGLNLSNMNISDNEITYSDDYQLKPGFHIGAHVDLPFNEMFSLETGLTFGTKGYRFKESGSTFFGTYSIEQRMNLFYLDIPVLAKLTFNIGEAKIYAGFGPYIGIGLAGITYTEVTFFGETDIQRDDVKWGTDDTSDLRKLDFGLMTEVGFEINSLFFEAGYAYGLANIAPNQDNGFRINNSVLSFSVGYRFRND